MWNSQEFAIICYAGSRTHQGHCATGRLSQPSLWRCSRVSSIGEQTTAVDERRGDLDHIGFTALWVGYHSHPSGNVLVRLRSVCASSIGGQETTVDERRGRMSAMSIVTSV